MIFLFIKIVHIRLNVFSIQLVRPTVLQEYER